MAAMNVVGNIFPDILESGGEGRLTTILAYGALLSKKSSRLTFPHLTNFRLVRVRGLRRVFGHPHLFLIEQNLVDLSDPTRRLASLQAEEVEGEVQTTTTKTTGFTVAAFDVMLDDQQRTAFIERERGYRIVNVPYYNLHDSDNDTAGIGVICLAGTGDDQLPSELGPTVDRLKAIGKSVWNWKKDSGLLPADVYLRHGLLSVKKAGRIAEQSFLKETYLADRTTTLAEYLSNDDVLKRVMDARPPDELMSRFNG